jgi:CheY-like chemotaxis protein
MVTQPAPSVPSRIHVLIVDQHLAFRDALAARLQAEPDLAVVGKAHSAEFAPRVLVGRSADVILLDADLPDDSAIAFCAEMTQRADAPRVVMLSAASTPERPSSPGYPRRCPRRGMGASTGAMPGAAPARREAGRPARPR